MTKTTIGTHSGRFHTDEVLAVVMLQYLPEYKNAEIIRTRDMKELDACTIIVDVGGVYDHSKKRYDHHQKTFVDTLDEEHSIRLSSAGLIYKHYGKEILKIGFNITEEKKRDLIYNCVYTALIESVDAVDNGVNQYEGEMKYQINTTLQNRVSRFNPTFLEKDVDENKLFRKAMEIVKEEFESFVKYYRDVWYIAGDIVREAIDKRFEVHASGRVIKLSQNCPYWDHLYREERERKIEGIILFVLYQDRNNAYRCGAVSQEKEGFALRLPFAEKCRGLSGEELEKISGIKDIGFVHNSGFTSGGTLESLFKLIELTMHENGIKW